MLGKSSKDTRWMQRLVLRGLRLVVRRVYKDFLTDKTTNLKEPGQNKKIWIDEVNFIVKNRNQV